MCKVVCLISVTVTTAWLFCILEVTTGVRHPPPPRLPPVRHTLHTRTKFSVRYLQLHRILGWLLVGGILVVTTFCVLGDEEIWGSRRGFSTPSHVRFTG